MVQQLQEGCPGAPAGGWAKQSAIDRVNNFVCLVGARGALNASFDPNPGGMLTPGAEHAIVRMTQADALAIDTASEGTSKLTLNSRVVVPACVKNFLDALKPTAPDQPPPMAAARKRFGGRCFIPHPAIELDDAAWKHHYAEAW